MKIHYTHEIELNDAASALVKFDMESIGQMVSAERATQPAAWVAEPDGYQQDGHVLRDSDTIRLIAYVVDSGTIYATDGCNSCRHAIRIETSSVVELEAVAESTQLPLPMLVLLSQQVSERQ
jgi:hypothetical protein